MNFTIRPLAAPDEPFLWEMLYQAIYIPEGEQPLSRDVIYLPELARYVRDWGHIGDCPSDRGFCSIDTVSHRPVGAVWLRLLTGEDRGYGYIDDNTPELSIAVLPEYRGLGIGTQLLAELLRSDSERSPISLSVSVDNPARRLYERFGFEIVNKSAGSLTMKRG